MWSLHLAAAGHRVTVLRMSISDYRYFEVIGWFGFFVVLPAVAHQARGTEERDAG